MRFDAQKKNQTNYYTLTPAPGTGSALPGIFLDKLDDHTGHILIGRFFYAFESRTGIDFHDCGDSCALTCLMPPHQLLDYSQSRLLCR